MLLERDHELEVVGRAVERTLEGAGTLLVIDGPAGAGKTALLEAARDAAAGAGLLVLHARGSELEREFAFGVVRQMFEDVAPADWFEEPLSARDESPFGARHAVYRLVADLAADRPLALLVDDAHWADEDSLGALAHVANRLAGGPVVLVVAGRSDASCAMLDALRLQADDGATLLPSPLGRASAAAIVRSFVADADDALCNASHAASGGNPFLLTELARSLPDAERMPDRSPERVTREVGATLARLPDAATLLAHAAAVVGSKVSVRQAAALADLTMDDAAMAVDRLVSAGLLRDAQPLEFLHPLVRTAVSDAIGSAPRSATHARAARLFADEDADPERVAAQLIHCQPAGDRWAYERLAAAGRAAAERGAWTTATTYLRRAFVEPPPPECRVALLLDLGSAESRACDPVAAIAHLRAALGGHLDAGQRLRATTLLGRLLGQNAQVADAVDLLEQELDDADVATTTEVALADIARSDPMTRPRVENLLAGLRRRAADGDERDPAVLGLVAGEMAETGEAADRTAAIAERALAGGFRSTTWHAIRALVAADRPDAALHALERAPGGGPVGAGALHGVRAELHLRAGDLVDAEANARAFQETCATSAWPAGDAWAAALLGEVLIERGELDEAAALLARGVFAAPARMLRQLPSTAALLVARGRLRRAQGRLEDAAEDLREAGRRVTAMGVLNPALLAWQSELAQVLADLGRDAEARRLADDAVSRAREFGAPGALGAALRTAAYVGGDVGQLREAVEVLEGSPARLEQARAHLDLGGALRSSGDVDRARDPLRIAAELAHRCGASALEENALSALRATGARPRRALITGVGALTQSERRVAELAAAGRLNREIAEDLFVTMHTVEFHLRNAYRKLGIRGRTQLTGALGTAAPQREPELALAA